jgi:hypothetical protein
MLSYIVLSCFLQIFMQIVPCKGRASEWMMCTAALFVPCSLSNFFEPKGVSTEEHEQSKQLATKQAACT